MLSMRSATPWLSAQSLTWIKVTVPTVVSCPGLPPTRGAWWEITCGWHCTPLNMVWNPRDLMTVRLAGTLPTKISTSASCNAVWYFHTSLTRQNYKLSFEGDSEWLRLFISPRAPPALRSLIRCFICPAHSDKVNYSSAFSSFTVSNCESITHWVDELVKQHTWGKKSAWTNGLPGIAQARLLGSNVSSGILGTEAVTYVSIYHSHRLNWSLLEARRGLNRSAGRDVSLSEKQLKMTNKT